MTVKLQLIVSYVLYQKKKVTNTIGKDIDVGCDTICVHSDTPNAVEIITDIKLALNR